MFTRPPDDPRSGKGCGAAAFLPAAPLRRSLGNATSVDYDDPHDLLVSQNRGCTELTRLWRATITGAGFYALDGPQRQSCRRGFRYCGVGRRHGCYGEDHGDFGGILLPASTPISLKRNRQLLCRSDPHTMAGALWGRPPRALSMTPYNS